MCSASSRCRCETCAPAGHSRESARTTAFRPALASTVPALSSWTCSAGKPPPRATTHSAFCGLWERNGLHNFEKTVKKMPAELDMAAFNTEYKNMKAVHA